MKTTDQILSEIRNLLEAERSHLLKGELDEIALLVPRKEALLQALVEAGLPNNEKLGQMRSAAEHNHTLLDSAMRGISSVATRLATMRRVRESLQSYDAAGKRKTLMVEKGAKFQKRA